MTDLVKEKLKTLPQKPGCYMMKNIDNEIIYVGKAKILANRVHSYFVGSHDAKTTKMVSCVNDFEYIITGSETEAFILEMNLIKKHRPKYNIMLMDDKRYPYICISEERHPRLYYTRDLNKKAKYFGPYPNGKAAKDVVEMLDKIYPLRKCQKIPKKECLYYHLGQCLAPCINEVEVEKYSTITSQITKFLKGNTQDEVKRLKGLMYEESEKLNFEKAKEYLDIINEIDVLTEKQKMEFDIIDSDIFGYVVKENHISIQIFHIRNGKMTERSGFLFDVMNDPTEMFVEFVGEFYFVYNNPIPKEIILPEVDISYIDENIKDLIVFPKKGKKKELLKLVIDNAIEKIDILLKKEAVKYDRTTGANIELGKLLGFDIHTIEAFDNSNIQGYDSVSAMVSYVDGIKNTKGYRKFKVKTVVGADDARTMYEIVKRRYSRLVNENAKLPDLIIMDGAVNQINFAKKALDEIGVNIHILGLVKDDNHKTNHLLFEGQEININQKSNLFLFLEGIQDEVHRYAITFFRSTHGKSTMESALDDIKGIGKTKKMQILSIVGKPNFVIELDKLRLSKEQKEEILKIYNI